MSFRVPGPPERFSIFSLDEVEGEEELVNQTELITPIKTRGRLVTVLRNNRFVVIDFYSDWCEPCKKIYPAVEHLAEKHRSKIKFIKINVKECEELDDLFSIEYLPTFVLIEGGNEVSRVNGASEEKLRNMIDKL